MEFQILVSGFSAEPLAKARLSMFASRVFGNLLMWGCQHSVYECSYVLSLTPSYCPTSRDNSYTCVCTCVSKSVFVCVWRIRNEGFASSAAEQSSIKRCVCVHHMCLKLCLAREFTPFPGPRIPQTNRNTNRVHKRTHTGRKLMEREANTLLCNALEYVFD